MSCTLHVPRGADLVRTYTFPTGTDLSGASASFKVYSEFGGSTLLTLGEVATGNGSILTLSGAVLTVLLKAADIATIPVAAPPTDPSMRQFDLFLTFAGGITSKVDGGGFVVQPVGARSRSDVTDISVSNGSTDITVQVAGGVNLGNITDLASTTIPPISATGAIGVPVVLKLNERASLMNFGLPSSPTADCDEVLEKAAYASAFDNIAIDLPARPYYLDHLRLPNNTIWNTETPDGEYQVRFIGQPGAVLIKTSGADNSYMVAAERWVDDVQYGTGPYFFQNIVFDGAGLADYGLVDVAYGHKIIDCVFRNCLTAGLFLPVKTKGGLSLLSSRATGSLRSLKAYNNGIGILVDRDAVAAPAATITDFEVEGATWLYDNGVNLDLRQSAGWKVGPGLHSWHYGRPPEEAYAARIRGNRALTLTRAIWEGHFFGSGGDPAEDVYGLQFETDGEPALVTGDFQGGLGLNVTFPAGTGLVRVDGGTFRDTAALRHGTSDSDCFIDSSGNQFDSTTPYQFSAAGAHAGITRATGDRITSDLRSYTGRQRHNDYSVEVPHETIYPTLPYAITSSDPDTLRFTTPLTADRTVTLPASPKRNQAYTVIRTATATGAFLLTVQTSGAVAVLNIGIGYRGRFVYDGANWFPDGYGPVS